MKHFWGKATIFVLCAIMMIAGFALIPNNETYISSTYARTEPHTRTELLPTRVNRISRVNREAEGLFFLRDHFWHLPGHFRGDVYMHLTPAPPDIRHDPNSFPPSFTTWRFEALLMREGRWELTSTLIVDASVLGDRAVWYLPHSAPAGLYAIRATLTYIDGTIREVETFGGARAPVVTYYYLLYAEELATINVSWQAPDGRFTNYVDVRGNNTIPNHIELTVMPNAGAINTTHIVTPEGFNFGNIASISTATIGTWELEINVTHNGNPVHGVIDYFWTGDNSIQLNLPNSLPAGVWSVSVMHGVSEITGQFVIDNSVPFSVNRSNFFQLFMIILGTLFAAVALFLFLMPALALRSQEKRYKNIITARGAPIVDPRTLEDGAANYEMLEENPGGTQPDSFIRKMTESKQKREWAKEHGISMEEFREMEAKGREVEEAKTSSLAHIRGEGVQIAHEVREEARETKRVVDGIEVDLLKSVLDTTVEGGDKEFVETVIKPNIDAAQQQSASILGRLRQLTGEDEHQG